MSKIGDLRDSDDGLSAPDTEKGRLQRACLELLREHERDEDGLPTNGRFVFYELEQRGIVPKHYAGKKRARLLAGWHLGH